MSAKIKVTYLTPINCKDKLAAQFFKDNDV